MPPLLADFTHARPCKPFCEKYLTLPSSLFMCSPPCSTNIYHRSAGIATERFGKIGAETHSFSPYLGCGVLVVRAPRLTTTSLVASIQCFKGYSRTNKFIPSADE